MLWLNDSWQKGYLLTSVTNKKKQGGKGGEIKTNKPEKREKKIKVQGSVSLIYKPKRYLKIYYVYMPQPYGHGSQLLNNNLQCI